MLINLVDIGEFDRKHDMVFLGRCDDVVRELCRELGWEEELLETWRGIGGGGRDLRGVRGQADKDPLDEITEEMEGVLEFSEGDVSVMDNHGQSKAEEDEHQMCSSDLAEEDSVEMQKV